SQYASHQDLGFITLLVKGVKSALLVSQEDPLDLWQPPGYGVSLRVNPGHGGGGSIPGAGNRTWSDSKEDYWGTLHFSQMPFFQGILWMGIVSNQGSCCKIHMHSNTLRILSSAKWTEKSISLEQQLLYSTMELRKTNAYVSSSSAVTFNTFSKCSC
ncbi:unnamed protein product, partial [Brassica rapa subsp. trilocularis]